jgi:hypothetical protein
MLKVIEHVVEHPVPLNANLCPVFGIERDFCGRSYLHLRAHGANRTFLLTTLRSDGIHLASPSDQTKNPVRKGSKSKPG